MKKSMILLPIDLILFLRGVSLYNRGKTWKLLLIIMRVIFVIRTVIFLWEESGWLLNKNLSDVHVQLWFQVVISSIEVATQSTSTALLVFHECNIRSYVAHLLRYRPRNSPTDFILFALSMVPFVITFVRIPMDYITFVYFFPPFFSNNILEFGYRLIWAITADWPFVILSLYYFIFHVDHIFHLKSLQIVRNALRKNSINQKQILDILLIHEESWKRFENFFGIQIFTVVIKCSDLSIDIVDFKHRWPEIKKDWGYLLGYITVFYIIGLGIVLILIGIKQSQLSFIYTNLKTKIVKSRSFDFEEKSILIHKIQSMLSNQVHYGSNCFPVTRTFLLTFLGTFLSYSVMFMEFGKLHE